MWQNLQIFLTGQGRRPIAWRLPGEHRSAKGFDIANIREFAPGDSARNINRKRFVFSGDQVVFEKNPDSNALLLVLLDVSASEYTGAVRNKIDAGIDLIHYFGTACLKRGHLLQVIAFTDIVELETAIIGNFHALEETLIELRTFSPAHRATDCREALEHAFLSATRSHQSADMVCLVSDLYFPAPYEELHLQLMDLQETTDIIVVCLQDRLEHDMPPIAGPILGRDAESGRMIWGTPPHEIGLLPGIRNLGIDYCFLETGQTEEMCFYVLNEFFSSRAQ
jgi:uncharacterized protein (DUF58 family)